MRFQIDDMTCGACARRVTKAIQAVDPAAEVEIDLDRRLAEVRSEQPSTAIASALASAGYPAVAAA
jgi:copper chaperone